MWLHPNVRKEGRTSSLCQPTLQKPWGLYKGSLAQGEANRSRQKLRLEVLQQKVAKLEQQRENLTAAYIDPDIRMSKVEFVKQKSAIDLDLNRVNDERENI